MIKQKMQAPGKDKELTNQRIYKKTLKWHTELAYDMCAKEYVILFLTIFAIVPVFVPIIFDFTRILFIGLILFFFYMHKKVFNILPLKLPAFANRVDYNDPTPGRQGFSEASGILYLGVNSDGYQLWLRNTDMTTHMLIYGTTGSGKTVSLQSIAYNAFVLGTGLIYIDPKGDPKLAHELFIMSRRVSREDDYLTMNFATGGKSSEVITPFKMSNTTNPFASATADAIVNLVSSLLDAGDGGGNKVFEQKAIAILKALVPILVALRDAEQSLPLTDMSNVDGINRFQGQLGAGMSIATIRDYYDPHACVSLVYPMKSKGKGNTAGQQTNMAHRKQGQVTPVEIDENTPIQPTDEECDALKRFVDQDKIDTLKSTLTSTNYNPNGDVVSKQQSYLDQFGYAKGYFSAPFSSISGMYGHMFNVSAGEVDMSDCLFNRRILVCILPSLEKSPSECESLGKIILASVKNAVSGGLGDKLEGKTKEVTGSLPSSSKLPGIIIVDEYAAIMMPGFEIIMTQARSLGFMAIVASQDYSGMKKKDAGSCDQIVENTKIKLFMTMTSAGETFDLAKSMFGSMNVEERRLDNPDLPGTIKNISKVTAFDLMAQIEGEFHAFYKGNLIHGSTSYLVPSIKEHHTMRINRFIRTDIVPSVIIKNIENRKLNKQSSDVYEIWVEDLIRNMDYPRLFEVRQKPSPSSEFTIEEKKATDITA